MRRKRRSAVMNFVWMMSSWIEYRSKNTLRFVDTFSAHDENLRLTIFDFYDIINFEKTHPERTDNL